jgi:hypothetical protein
MCPCGGGRAAGWISGVRSGLCVLSLSSVGSGRRRAFGCHRPGRAHIRPRLTADRRGGILISPLRIYTYTVRGYNPIDVWSAGPAVPARGVRTVPTPFVREDVEVRSSPDRDDPRTTTKRGDTQKAVGTRADREELPCGTVARPEAGRSSLACRVGSDRVSAARAESGWPWRYVFGLGWARHPSRCSIPCFSTLPLVIAPSIQSGLSSGAVSRHAHAS